MAKTDKSEQASLLTPGTVRWVRKPNLEAWLTKMKLNWSYVKNVPLSSLSYGEKNSVRLYEKFNPIKAGEIGVQIIEPGLELHGLVASDDDKEVLGGNHRAVGCEHAEVEYVDCYMIKGLGPTTKRAVAARDNRDVGDRIKPDENIQIAVSLVNHDDEIQQIAELFDIVPWTKLRDAVRVNRLMILMSQPNTHVPHRENLSKGSLARLLSAKSKVNEPILIEMARTIAKYKNIKEPQVKTLIDAVLAADPKTDENMRTIMLAQEQILNAQQIRTKGKVATRSPVVRLLMETHRALTLTDQFEKQNARDIFPGEDDRKEFEKTARMIVTRFQKAIKQLKEGS